MRRLAVVLFVAAACGCIARGGAEERGRDAGGRTRVSTLRPSTKTSASLCGGCTSIERCEEGACVPACPEGEVFIPATGPEGFVMGKGFTLNGGARRLGKGHKPDTDRPHRVILTKPFCMDEAEVTVAAMKECVATKGCAEPKIYEVFANYPKK